MACTFATRSSFSKHNMFYSKSYDRRIHHVTTATSRPQRGTSRHGVLDRPVQLSQELRAPAASYCRRPCCTSVLSVAPAVPPSRLDETTATKMQSHGTARSPYPGNADNRAHSGRIVGIALGKSTANSHKFALVARLHRHRADVSGANRKPLCAHRSANPGFLRI